MRTLRLVAWNLENVKPWLADGRLAGHAIEKLRDPDVLCLQEIRLRPIDRAEIAQLDQLLPGSPQSCAAAAT